MLPLVVAGIVSKLAENGLGLLANAVTAKGKEVIEEKLGINIEQATQTPEGLMKLKQAEFDHEEFLVEASIRKAEQSLEAQRIENANTANARDTNAKIQESANASKLAKNAAYILDFVIVGCTFLMMLFLFFKGVPTENKEFFYMALGSLLTMCASVVNFHRGSSSGSKAATEFLHNKMLSK